MRLMCFPYAGASAMVYSRWRRQVPDWLEIQPVELPGRGIRLSELLARDWNSLIETLIAEIAGFTDQPYALFGHSFGALVAFETAHTLRERGFPMPRALIVSGTHAPSRRDNRRFENLETDEELRAEMRRLNGTDSAVLASEELMALTLPILRADFGLCARYRRPQRPLLTVPVHVLAGKQDKTTPETLGAWQLETNADFTLDIFDGDHFFIQTQETRVLVTLIRYLNSARATHSGVCLAETF